MFETGIRDHLNDLGNIFQFTMLITHENMRCCHACADEAGPHNFFKVWRDF